ncbi:DUF4397 domain-containing protein [Eubacteriales bacterium SGI.150]
MDESFTPGNRSAGRNPPDVLPEMALPAAPLPPLVPEEPPQGPGPEPSAAFPFFPEESQLEPPDTEREPFSVAPLPPVTGRTELPGCPAGAPSIPPSPHYCTVRFFHAAAGLEPVRITVGPLLMTSGLAYGGRTGYTRISDGFRLVTVTSAYTPRTILFQQTLPFRAGELITMAVVHTSSGLDLLRISDLPCDNRPAGRACIRAVNLCYGSPALDIFLDDGRLVFSDVGYKEVTAFRQARPQEYGFSILQAAWLPTPYPTDIETVGDLPAVASYDDSSDYGGARPLASFYLEAKANSIYSLYLLGRWDGAPPLQVQVVESL